MPYSLPNRQLAAFPHQIPRDETQILLQSNKIPSIPENIGEFKKLTHLYLHQNQINSIPPQIGNLKSLVALLLGHNQIEFIPNEIGELTNLTQLRIENNKLKELPKEIGKLTNLTHLYLDNNLLTALPEEIRSLKKLIFLSISGNQVTLPSNYSTNTPANTINHILELQAENNLKDSVITSKAYYFINASKGQIIKKFEDTITTVVEKNIVNFLYIESPKGISPDTNLVFIVAPIDTHDNESLMFDIASACKKNGIRFFILIQEKFIETDFEYANLSKWETIKNSVTKIQELYSNNCKSFSSYDELNNIIFEALKQHKPNVRLNKLTLLNIGHFSNLVISLDNNITCLIGENGTGKSTILKALALAIIGTDNRKINEKARRGLLKIQGYSDKNIIYEKGEIILEYSIDGDTYINQLELVPNDNGNDIIIESKGESQIIYNKYNLKSLIIGFPQARGNEILDDTNFIKNKITQPHLNDLIPLINNIDDHRLRSFTGWIAGLYFDSINSTSSHEKNSYQKLIEESFTIISKITKKVIKFKLVTKIDPPDVWVITDDAPNGVPLSLVSQGFKIVIGWIGYLLERFVITFPLSDPKTAFKENSIVLLDEVDISMHPIWQLSFIPLLRETFPNTQFILTTHDPLIVGGLSKEQVRILTEENSLIKVIQPETDPKGMGVAGILTSELFGLKSTLDDETLEYLKKRNELIVKQENKSITDAEKTELSEIFHFLNSLGINTTDRDPLYQKFIVAMQKHYSFGKEKYTMEELKQQDQIASKILKEILEEEKKE